MHTQPSTPTHTTTNKHKQPPTHTHTITKKYTQNNQGLYEDAGIKVEGFYGGRNGSFDEVDVAICTIEKANNLINKLMEEERLDELGGSHVVSLFVFNAY